MLKKWSKKKILLCPVCNKPYEYCHGEVKTPYFRHMDKAECDDKYSESETEEHLNGKRDLYEWIKCQKGVKNAILEGWLPETKQRPDVMFEYDDKKYVVEYQCTPIATEYIERHKLYEAAGIHDIWICGTEKYLKSNMRGKYLETISVGFYDSKNGNYISISNSKFYYKMENINCRYYHSVNDFYGLKLNTFGFNGSIYNILYGDVNVANEKRLYRSINKDIDVEYSEKYLKLQNEKLWNQLCNNLNVLSNENWKFYIFKFKNKYATYTSICAEPRILYEMSYYERKHIGIKYYSKIGLTYMKDEELKKCARDIEYLKSILLPLMIDNKKRLLNYHFHDKRILEVKHE